MPLDPFLAPFLVDYPHTPEVVEDYVAFRAAAKEGVDAALREFAEPGPQVAGLRRVTVPVQGGQIDLNVYTPEGTGPFPVHVYLHGGGWVTGSIDHLYVDHTCRERCVGAQCVVVSVDYRKAPEHTFPVPLEDCAAAVEWVVEHAVDLEVDASRLTLGGSSAGANLAAGLALLLRDRGGPPVTLQLLEVPPLDLTLSQPSHRRYDAYALSYRDLELARAAYLASPGQATHPLASPLLAPDLTGLPPAHVMISEFDALRDDGAAYVARLEAAGVPATLSLQLGHVHNSSMLTKMAAARTWRAEVDRVLCQANGTG